MSKNEYKIIIIFILSPVLVAPSAHVLHGSEATGDTGETVEVVQNSTTYLQVVRVPGGLRDNSSLDMSKERVHQLLYVLVCMLEGQRQKQ